MPAESAIYFQHQNSADSMINVRQPWFRLIRLFYNFGFFYLPPGGHISIFLVGEFFVCTPRTNKIYLTFRIISLSLPLSFSSLSICLSVSDYFCVRHIYLSLSICVSHVCVGQSFSLTLSQSPQFLSVCTRLRDSASVSVYFCFSASAYLMVSSLSPPLSFLSSLVVCGGQKNCALNTTRTPGRTDRKPSRRPFKFGGKLGCLQAKKQLRQFGAARHFVLFTPRRQLVRQSRHLAVTAEAPISGRFTLPSSSFHAGGTATPLLVTCHATTKAGRKSWRVGLFIPPPRDLTYLLLVCYAPWWWNLPVANYTL